MGRMAETVVKKSNEAEKAFEIKLLENAQKIDKIAEEKEKKKRTMSEIENQRLKKYQIYK